MNEFRQHIPSFVETMGEKQPIYEFETLDDLLSLEVVKRYSKDKDFSYFALSRNKLMEIGDDGFYWWVVGYIKNPDKLDLPEWKGGKWRAELQNGKQVVLEHGEVDSICGGVLTLKDGTKAKEIKKKK